MHQTLLLSDPLLGSSMWDAVQRRLSLLGTTTETLTLVEPGDRSIEDAQERLDAALTSSSAPTILIAHGAAVPLAIRAAAAHPPAGLVLTSGPLLTLDPIRALLARIPEPLLARALLQPGLWLRGLASSAGLRRAVVNPYVMDRDTVVAICGPTVRSQAHRVALARFLRSLPGALPPLPYSGPTLLLSPGEDPLCPVDIEDRARRILPAMEHRVLLGARHLHPVEQPWSFADQVHAWVQKRLTTTSVS